MLKPFCPPTIMSGVRVLSPLVMVTMVLVVATIGFARTWKSNDGKYSVDAEFVGREDDTVSLRKTDGDIIRVPIARLCDQDQAFLAECTAADRAPASSSPADSPPADSSQADSSPADLPVASPQAAKNRNFRQLVQTANRLRTAAEVLRLYKIFVQDETISEADRKAAEKQLPVWEERTNKQMVRVGLRWLPPSEANDQRIQARQLVDEAMRLIEVEQYDAAIDKCVKASKIDEDSILPDFILGLGYALLRNDAKEANRHFAECVRRHPEHISALNNLAISEIRLHQYDRALGHWEAALALAPASSEVIQNLGRATYLAQHGGIHVPPAAERRFRDLYAAAAVSVDAGKFSDRTGWLYLGYCAPLGEKALIDQQSNPGSKKSKDRLMTVGSGTGFVVHPGYVLTNRHVVEHSGGISVVPPEGAGAELPATVVAVGKTPDDDLAVIHCDGLAAPPLPFINRNLASRGTEIMVLGFPGMHQGAKPSLKSTRGIVAGLPDESFNFYALDAVTNPGNSGGPICDATGSVLGIHCARTVQLNMNYGLAVPHSRALPLLESCIPGYQQVPPEAEIKAWSQVDELASRSTVLIWIKGLASNAGISQTTKKQESSQILEDRWCMICNGRGTVECPNRDCQNGTLGGTRMEHTWTNPISGEKLYRPVHIRVPCKTCDGKGIVDCPHCDHGIDRSLR